MSDRRPVLRLVRGATGSDGAAAVVPADPRATLELAGLGTALVFIAVLLARIPSWRGELGTFQALVTVAFLAWAVAVARVQRVVDDRSAMWVVIAVAAAARLAMLPVAPTLSDDVFRYLWEGRVLASGANPYALAPEAASLTLLRDTAIHPRVNHPHLAALYPPLALAGFALVSKISYTLLAMKSWVILWDLGLCVALVAWCRAAGIGAAAAVVYAWNPLVLVEYAGTGHHDPTALLPLALAFLWRDRRPTASALALAVATLVKFAPLLALPFLWRRWPWRARWLALGAIGAGIAVQLAATGALEGGHSGLVAYAATWRHNDSVFAALEWIARSPGWARVLAAILVLGVVGFVVRRTDETTGAARAQQVAMLLSPVLHPWYLGWVLLFQPFGRSVFWLLLSWTAFVSYGAASPPAGGGGWHPTPALRLFEYGLPLVVAAGWWIWNRRGHAIEPRGERP